MKQPRSWRLAGLRILFWVHQSSWRSSPIVPIRIGENSKLPMTSKSEKSDDHHWCAGHIRYDEQPVGLTVYPFYSTRCRSLPSDMPGASTNCFFYVRYV